MGAPHMCPQAKAGAQSPERTELSRYTVFRPHRCSRGSSPPPTPTPFRETSRDVGRWHRLV